VTTPAQKLHQQPALARGEASEWRRIAADFERNVRIIEAAVAPSPELVERLDVLEHIVRDQGAQLQAQAVRIAALEARPADDEDGEPLAAGEWCRMAEAMRRTFYSRSGLLKLCRQGKIRFDFEGAHRLIDISSVPRKISSASAQSAHCK
jgi:hypothetical protein